MDNSDQTIKMTELVIEALNYANSNNLDITSESDIEKILSAIDPNSSFVSDTQEFMRLMKAANALIEKDVNQRRSVN